MKKSINYCNWLLRFYSDKAEEKTGPMSDLGLTQETINNAGTTLGVSGAKEAIRVQQEYIKNNRLQIPTILMADIIHGFRTIFPIPLALGSSWDLNAAEQMAEISAREAAVSRAPCDVLANGGLESETLVGDE